MSLQSGDVSGELSGSITEVVHRFLTGLFPGWDLELTTLHWLVRKAAHVGSYFVLGVLWSNTLRLYGRPMRQTLWIGIGLSVLGEVLQMFAENRGPSILDALLFNAVGFVFGWLAWMLWFSRRAQNKQNVS